jgi:hypothetical protein
MLTPTERLLGYMRNVGGIMLTTIPEYYLAREGLFKYKNSKLFGSESDETLSSSSSYLALTLLHYFITSME